MLVQNPDKKLVTAPVLELKACPECFYYGEKYLYAINLHSIFATDPAWCVHCANCRFENKWKLTRESAVSDWNSLERRDKTAIEIIESLITDVIFSANWEAEYRYLQEPILSRSQIDAVNYLVDNGYLKNDGQRRRAWLWDYLSERIN